MDVDYEYHNCIIYTYIYISYVCIDACAQEYTAFVLLINGLHDVKDFYCRLITLLLRE